MNEVGTSNIVELLASILLINPQSENVNKKTRGGEGCQSFTKNIPIL